MEIFKKFTINDWLMLNDFNLRNHHEQLPTTLYVLIKPWRILFYSANIKIIKK